MKLVVGLGNPGVEYQNTRHNIGFRVLDELVTKWEDDKKLKSQIAKTDKIIFAKPQTYMNNSGIAVKLLARYYKMVPEDIIIVHDDLDLPLGKIQVRCGGSAAGHHGIESIMDALGTDQFNRIRIGIGPGVGAADKFVLESFTKVEQLQVKQVTGQALKAIDVLLKKGLEVAQNQFN